MADFHDSHGLMMDLEASPMVDLGPDDESYDDQTAEETEKAEEADEGWYDLPLRKRWESVMERLSRNELLWDDEDAEPDDWDPSMKVLEARERESLADIDPLDKTSPTILHMLAKDPRDQSFHELPLKVRLKIVQYLLQHRRYSLQVASVQSAGIPQDPILTRALEHDNREFIHFILSHCKSSLAELLEAKDIKGSNPLHYMFKVHLPEAVDRHLRAARRNGKAAKERRLDLQASIPILSHFISRARPQCVTARDDSLNTPIHYALDYRICRMPIDLYPSLVAFLVRTGDETFKTSADKEWQFNKDGESPYCYFRRSQDEYLAGLRKPPAQDPLLASSWRPHAANSSESRPGKETKPGTQDEKDSKGPLAKTEDGARGGVGAYLKNAKDMTGRGKWDTPKAPTEPERGLAPGKPVQEPRLDVKGTGLQGQPGKKPPNLTGGSGLSRSSTQNLSGTLSPVITIRAAGLSAEVEKSSSLVGKESKPVESLTPQVESLSNASQAAGFVSSRTHPTTQSKNVAHAHGKQQAQQPGTPYKTAVETEKFRTTAERIRRLLQFHYIRERPDMEAKELLYGRIASDKNLYFDATHMRDKSPEEVAGLIQMLDKPGGFEDTLSYVNLPVLSYTAAKKTTGSGTSSTSSYAANQTRPRENDAQVDSMVGRNSAVAVFDKLAQVGVRTILHLHVEEDIKTPPHTDSSIERAIRGQDSLAPSNKREEDGIAIETWNWRKFDLSTDVIGFAAPKVTTINLYWSGNQMVLRGWACNEGIPRLYKASEKSLKRVHVHWSPGFEGAQRCQELLKNFKKEVEQATAEPVASREQPGSVARRPGVTVTLKKLSSSKTAGPGADNSLGPFTPGNPRAPPDHGWIESMESFRKALVRLHDGLPKDCRPERTKVALIDDGIDRTKLHTYSDRVEVTGMSYLTPSAGMALQNPSWHQSTHGHGTVMANSIVRVNPWVFLYAMRIQDEVDFGPRNDASIRIHAGSAARAIEDAIIKKVDIISISWTIRNMASQDGHGRSLQGQEINEVRALKKAIDGARKAGILIFCSASDDVQKKGVDTLPYSQARDHAFRIGAADAYGWSDRVTEDHRTIDWFFPGSQVADDFNPRSARAGELQYRDGSSVATALAAGLASLIIYMASLMKAYARPGSKNAGKFSDIAGSLRRTDAMRKAFDNIITDENYKDKKFLPVWDLFRTGAKKMLEETDDVARWDVLEELCRKLAS